MKAETRSVLRWTASSALACGGLFAAGASLRALGAGVSLSEVAGPIAALSVVGATVGGLVGPLIRGASARLRGR